MDEAGRRETGRGGAATRRRIVDAAIETLKAEGFAGASARAIARRGDFNQALIFYHFSSLHGLLLAVLDETSRRRLAHWEEATSKTTTLPELLATTAELYSEDLASGHVTVLVELIGGSVAHPELRAEVSARMEPWVAFAERAIRRALGGSPAGALLPAGDGALAVTAMFLGLQLITHLDGSPERAAALFDRAQALAAVLGPLIEATAPLDTGS